VFNRVEYGKRNGQSATVASANCGGSGRTGPVSDTNGDGKGDVLVTGTTGGVAGLWRFGGAGSGTLYAPRSVVENSAFLVGAKVAVTDVNGDGRADAVLARGNAANQTELFVWAGNTDGTLAPQWTRDGLLGVSLDTVQLAAGDTEGDGRGDVLITSRARNGAGGLWRFGGAGSGTLYSPRAVVENSAFLAGAKVAVTDVNGDGRADAVLARRNDANQTELLIWAGNTDGTLAPRWSRDGLLGVPVNAADIN
jgi:hypothetical protein